MVFWETFQTHTHSDWFDNNLCIILDETRMVAWLFAFIPIGFVLKSIKIPFLRYVYSLIMGLIVSFSLYKEGQMFIKINKT